MRRTWPSALRLRSGLALLLVLALGATARTVPPADTIAAGTDTWAGDLAPIAASDWTPERAAHLIERAGFGAAPDEIARLAALTPQRAVDELVDYEKIASELKPFDESVIWDPGMDPFPPSRAEAVRIARERGVGLGEKVLPPGAQRRLQPVVDKFFYGLYANGIETQRLGFVVGESHARRQAAARRKADALLARALRDRRKQSTRLPDDAPPERDVPGARVGTVSRSARRDSQGPGDARVSRQRREREVASQRELWPRAARAVHDGRRQLHRARRPRSRARVHGVDQRRPGVQVRRGAARCRREDLPREGRPLQRRGHRGRDPCAARDGGVRGGEGLSLLRPRRDRRAGQNRVGPRLSRQRLPDEAAPEAHLSVEGLLQRAGRRDANQESRPARGVHLPGSCRSPRSRRFQISAG